MSIKCIFTSCLLCFGIVVWATPKPMMPEGDSLFRLLKKKTLEGDKRAFRDLGSLLDGASPMEIKEALDDISFISDDLMDLKKELTRADFLNFYYQNQSKISFSTLFNAFYIKGFDKKKIEFQVKPSTENTNDDLVKIKDFSTKIEAFLVAENADSVYHLLEKAQQIHHKSTYQLFLKIAKDKRIWSNKTLRKNNVSRLICESLANYPTEESFNTILFLIDNGYLAPALAAFSLARVSNVFAAHEGTDATLSKRYQHYADSLKTFDALRNFGFARYNHFQRIYFDEDVDYYAAFAATAFVTDSYWWIRENAISEMLKTHHPRALYYLASQYYRERNRNVQFSYSASFFLQGLKSWVNEKIEVKDKNGFFTSEPTDLTAKKNLFLYWSQHWDDYEWDDFLGIFVNKQEKLAQKENYDRLFRRLSSTNDSVAVQSYKALSEGEPSEIVKLDTKYRSLLRNVNPNLPNFKSKILENTAFLTDYCRKQGIAYRATEKDLALFNILLSNLTPSQRYLVENQVIEKLTLPQITIFEYWAILHETTNAANYSFSRILDRWYSQHWREVLSDDHQLRLLLKKTALFSHFGVVGTCNQYVKKINVKDDNFRKYLQAIVAIENDNDINALAQQLLSDKIDDKNTSNLNNTPSGDLNNIKNLISIIENTDILDIEAINALTQSTNYKAEHRSIALKALTKVTPIDEMFLLKIQPKLSLKGGDLQYFKGISLGYKDLDDLPRIFEMDDSEKMFAFMNERAQDFTVDEAGAFYNNLFRSAWFSNYINGGLFPKGAAEELKTLLNRYLNESTLISEFEEQATQRNIMQLENIGRSLSDKLSNALNSSSDDETKSKIIGEIIARINYEDLGLVVPFMMQMNELNGRSPLAFLNEDFGLPIFEFKNFQESNEFVQNHAKLSELELYKLYLQKFGVDFQKKDGNLDYEKIYRILKYDLVTPFTGSGNNKRDYCVYGLIKVLELKFVTRLGFHQKMNESQTFYSYNSSKRVETWLKYMVENRIYRPDSEDIKSFNQ